MKDDRVEPPPFSQHTSKPVSPSRSSSPPKQEWWIKKREEASSPSTLEESEKRTTANDVIQIGTHTVAIYHGFDGSIIIDDRVDTPMPDAPAKKEKEKTEELDKSKYYRPRWCPPSLTPTQKRKLQRLRLKVMREQEQEKRRDEFFNEIKPMVPQRQEWRRKKAEHNSLEASGQTVDVPVGPTRKGEIQNLSGPATVRPPLSWLD